MSCTLGIQNLDSLNVQSSKDYMAITRNIKFKGLNNDFSAMNLSMYTMSGKVSVELSIYGRSGGRLVFEKSMEQTIAMFEETLAALKDMNKERGEQIQKMIEAGKKMK